MRSAIVIGSGLGGLECALVLLRHGYGVTVLEKGRQAGGCLQTFVRGGRRFDTGFHYVGGLGPGEPLRPLADYFDLTDLPWEPTTEEILIGDERFRIPAGIDAYVAMLADRFPAERGALEAYGKLLREVGDHIFDAFDNGPSPLMGVSAAQYIRDNFRDPLLRKVLSGSNIRLCQDADTLPLYAFAQIGGSYIRSAWRLPGGGKAITDRLVARIEALGGVIRTGAEVTGLRLADGIVSEVLVGENESLRADVIVSDAHPAVTVALLQGSGVIKKVYRERILSLENSPGLFTANILLKDSNFPLPEGELHIHREDADLWRKDPDRTDSVLVHTYPEGGMLDILSPMPLPERDGDYAGRKRIKLGQCLDLAEKGVPGLRDAIDKVYTSTPRTWHEYTGIPGGSAFGILKDWKSPLTTLLSPRTTAGNLYLTGGSLNLHGMLGVSITALMTAAEILGRQIYLEIKR
jgi:all-trans-retinol 13,14-reductase